MDGDNQSTDSPSKKSEKDEIEQDSPEKKDEKNDEKVKKPAEDLIVAEETIQGSVPWSLYYKYMEFSYGKKGIFAYFTVSLICGFIQLFTSYYLSYWSALPFKEQ